MATNKRLIKSNDDTAPVVPTSFNTVLWTGNATARSITGVGFQPDFVWIKNRDAVQHHNLIDSVRGNTKLLYSSLTNAEATTTNHITSFDSDGFSLGTATSANGNGNGIVAWCWKAGGAAVTNTDGTITSQVSANTEAGFSIVKFTGINLSSNTIGHGLGVTPSLVIMKGTNVATEWRVYSDELASDAFLKLNETSAAVNIGINKTWTSTTISQQWAPATYDWIAYCFAEVAGFSKFGSYTGTGAGVQNTINCGFAPKFVMIKRTNSTGGWRMYDNVRGLDRSIQAQSSNAEYDDTTNYLDFYANGFEFNNGVSYQSNPDINASGGTYIYMAFANQF